MWEWQAPHKSSQVRQMDLGNLFRVRVNARAGRTPTSCRIAWATSLTTSRAVATHYAHQSALKLRMLIHPPCVAFVARGLVAQQRQNSTKLICVLDGLSWYPRSKPAPIIAVSSCDFADQVTGHYSIGRASGCVSHLAGHLYYMGV